MRTSIFRTAIYGIGLLAACSCAHQSDEDRFVENLLSQMTLEEKIGQMNQLDPTYDTESKEVLIREGKVGALLNGIGAKEVNRLQRMAVEETRLGIPLIMGRDVIHGYKTIFPIPLGQAATWNPELIEHAAQITAQEAYQDGIRWAFSPMVDVARDPRWGRVAEGYGEDSYLASAFAAATVRGYQSPNPASSIKQQTAFPLMAACVKHFAGYSASEGGRDYNATWIPEVQLRDVYLPPFKAAVDAGAMSLMCSFNTINGMPSSANKHLNIDILRNEWHSDALLVSDWGSGMDLIPHGLCVDRKEAALRCINARMEMDMQGQIYHEHLAELVKEKKVPESMIDDCVRSILRMKYRLGLFEHPYVPEEDPVFYSPEALTMATEAVEQSVVLLKNNGILPLNNTSHIKNQTSNILITGPLANQPKEQLGTWVFDGEPDHAITPLMAFQQLSIVNPQLSITYDSGLQYSRDKSTSGFAKAVEAAHKADVILFFAGEEAILSGEARCRADLSLPGAQTELLTALKATGKPIVLIVMAGRPLTIGNEVEMADAVLYSFHGGTMAGPGLANIITGKAVPSGKLPMTFPKMVGQIPFYYNRLNSGRPCADNAVLLDDIPVGAPQFSIGASSYWLESVVEPLFHFGYGLSYTTFEYGETVIESKGRSIGDNGMLAISPDNDPYTVSCTIKNTGSYDAYEVAQLYVHQCSGDLARPICELKGFEKIFIPAGETRTVSFTLTPEQLGYWHEEKDGLNSRVWYATDNAYFKIRISPDCRLPL